MLTSIAVNLKAKPPKKSLRKSGFREPVEMAGIMMLFILGVVMFPTRRMVGWFYKGEDEFVFLLADGIQRMLFTAMMFHFIKSFGFRFWPLKTQLKPLLVVLPALVIAVNNYPFVVNIMGECHLDFTRFEIISFALWCFGVGLFEEVAFRGVMLPLVLIRVQKSKKQAIKKHPVFFTVAISSAV